MKINIIAQVKSILQAILRYVPAFGDGWLYPQAVIYLHQAIIQLIIHPYRILVARERWIKGAETFVEIDVEDGFFGGRLIGAAGVGKEKDYYNPKKRQPVHFAKDKDKSAVEQR